MQKHVAKPSLVCDSCHHEVEVSHIARDLIGISCPVCEESMLTAADFKAWRRFKFWNWVQVTFAWLFLDHKNFSVNVVDGSIAWRVEE